MKRLYWISILVLASGCFSPSQNQVDKAVHKEMEAREDEKKRVFAYIDEYIKEKGTFPTGVPTGAPARPSIEDQLKHPKRVDLGESPVKGYRNARVAIYEFSDFQCPFCQKVDLVLDDVLQKYAGKVKLIYKFFPQPIYPDSRNAALAAIAAQKQGKFWEMHDRMINNQTALKRENLIDYAKAEGMDVAKFEKDMDSLKASQRIETEVKQAAQLGITTAPTFFINGVELTNVQNESDFTNIIDVILKK